MKMVSIAAACWMCLMFGAGSVTARNETSIEDVRSMSYNESLKVFNEAKKDIEDVRESIANLEKDIEKSIELQNEVGRKLLKKKTEKPPFLESISLGIMVDGQFSLSWRPKYDWSGQSVETVKVN